MENEQNKLVPNDEILNYSDNSTNRPTQINLDCIHKPSKWYWFIITLGVLQVILLILMLIIFLWLSSLLTEGTGFAAILYIGPLYIFNVIISIINLINIPLYIIKRKPYGKYLLALGISLIISMLSVLELTLALSV